ncbi:Agamous-like MADS-box protein AGL19 [Bienertia sinuspersici]
MTIDRYQRHMKELRGVKSKVSDQNLQQFKDNANELEKKLQSLEISKRKLLGDGLETCSIDELQELEKQLDKSLSNIRARKEKLLLKENSRLKEKLQISSPIPLACCESSEEDEENSMEEVETELFIGPPESRNTRCLPHN